MTVAKSCNHHAHAIRHMTSARQSWHSVSNRLLFNACYYNACKLESYSKCQDDPMPISPSRCVAGCTGCLLRWALKHYTVAQHLIGSSDFVLFSFCNTFFMFDSCVIWLSWLHQLFSSRLYLNILLFSLS